MPYSLTIGSCGCLKLWDVGFSAYIVEGTTKNSLSANYTPYTPENDDEIYYVPENYSDMAQPQKHSEDSTAPSLNAMALFIGIQDNGDDTYTNYNFTPDQLVSYVMENTRKRVTITADMITDGGATVTIPWASGKVISSIVTQRTAYQEGDDFTQASGGVINGSEITFFEGQKIILYL